MSEKVYSVNIQPSAFSHKIIPGKRSGHAFLLGCNFKCSFCGVRAQEPNKLISPMSADELRDQIKKVSEIDGSIKIGGQEPTTDFSAMRVVAVMAKEAKCEVIVDTNGSRPNEIISLAQEGLIDQVEVGLKGFSRQEAKTNSGTGSIFLSWENPLSLIQELSASFPKIRVWAHFVVYQGISNDQIAQTFSSLAADISSTNSNIRISNIQDPVREDIETHYERLCSKKKGISESKKAKMKEMLREHFKAKYHLRDALMPIPENDLVKRVRAIIRGTFWEGKIVLVLNPVGRMGLNGTEGLVWL